MLEDLTHAFEEDQEAIERGTQRSILAAQTALHSVLAIPSASSAGVGKPSDIGANLNQRQRAVVAKGAQPQQQQQQQPLPSRRSCDDAPAAKVPTPPSSPSLGGEVSIRHAGSGPKPPPRAKFSPAGPVAGATPSAPQSQPLKTQGGSGTPRGGADGTALRNTDPILVDSLVSILNGEGIPKDMALAAVVATGAESLDAARRWAAGAMGSGRGTLRTVRSLRDAGSTSVRVAGATNEKEYPSPDKFPTPQRQSKPLETTRGSTLPSPVKTGPAQSAQAPSFTNAPTLTNPAGLPGLSPQRSAPPLPWTIPSPTRPTNEAPTVSIQIRCDGGKLVHLERLFHPADNLLSVMHELFRVSPQFAPTTPEGGASLCFVVPFPKAKYAWSALASTTLTDANLCPRGTLVLQRL
jgi:hypothetical protein